MRMVTVAIALLIGSAGGCSQPPTPQPNISQVEERPECWPRDLSKVVGQTVTIEGTAGDAKLGALLLGDGDAIWIEGLDRWPTGFYPGGDKGKRLRVTGTVITRDDMPVFIQKRDEPPAIAGIPVQSEGELAKAKTRFLLKDAKWTVLE
jgi:hypothetical protein